MSYRVDTAKPAEGDLAVGVSQWRAAGRTARWSRTLAITLILASSCALLAPACKSRGAARAPRAPSGDPQRLVVLTPSLVEIAFALDLGQRIVGVTSFATYPPEAAKILKVGDFLQPNVEIITRLKPDLVLLDTVQVGARAALEGAGIYTLALPMESIEDVRSAVRAVGAATGRQAAAAQLIDQIDRDLGAASVRHVGRARPRVLFAVDREMGSLRNLVCAGPGTYIDELIRRAGGENVLGDARLRFFRVAPEEVVARRPAVILDAVHTTDAARARDDWRALPSVPAVQEGRVYVLADPAFVTPGPRLGQMLRRLTEILHPGSTTAPASKSADSLPGAAPASQP